MSRIIEQRTYVMMLLMQQSKSSRSVMVIEARRICKVYPMLSPICLENRIYSGIDQWVLLFNCIEWCEVSKEAMLCYMKLLKTSCNTRLCYQDFTSSTLDFNSIL